ncbi:MAG: DNA-directed RNA polymerase subunit alpha C-terminal domain-containing protein [Oscillospiraceae bacterium]|jgi:DNA-directed RNA polymerase alpha subunit
MARGKYKRRRENKTKRDLLALLDAQTFEEAGLPTRIVNLLGGAEINTMSVLAGTSDEELLAIKGLGSSYLEQIHQVLESNKTYQKFKTLNVE